MYGGTKASPKAASELEAYEEFRKSAKEHPRYRFLRLDDIASSCDPNLSPEPPQKPRRISKGSGPTKILLRFHSLVSTWNLDRIVKRLAEHGAYEKLKPKLVEILERQTIMGPGGGEEHQAYFDHSHPEEGEPDPPKGYVFEGDAYDSMPCVSFDNPPASIYGQSEASRELTQFLKEKFDFDLDYQGMALSRNDKMFKAGLRFVPDILLRAVKGTEARPEKKGAGLFRAQELTAERVFLVQCASCHREVHSLKAEAIPFHDPAKLKKTMSPELARKIKLSIESEDPAVRMPKNMPPLSQEERELILKFLKGRF